MHSVFPLLAAFIYFFTPAGCDKKINWVLTGLFVLIWAFDEAVEQINTPVAGLYDGMWQDVIIFSFYLYSAYLFYSYGGKIQSRLALVGVALSVVYAYVGFQIDFGWVGKIEFRDAYYYTETMIVLYFFQLFVAWGGMTFARINDITIGYIHEHGSGDSYYRAGAGRDHAGNGAP